MLLSFINYLNFIMNNKWNKKNIDDSLYLINLSKAKVILHLIFFGGSFLKFW